MGTERARLEEGGDWRREVEEEGGGAGRATKGGWKVRLAGGPTGRSLPAPSLALEPLPLFLPASAQREVREIWRLESSGFWGHGLQKWKVVITDLQAFLPCSCFHSELVSHCLPLEKKCKSLRGNSSPTCTFTWAPLLLAGQVLCLCSGPKPFHVPQNSVLSALPSPPVIVPTLQGQQNSLESPLCPHPAAATFNCLPLTASNPLVRHLHPIVHSIYSWWAIHDSMPPSVSSSYPVSQQHFKQGAAPFPWDTAGSLCKLLLSLLFSQTLNLRFSLSDFCPTLLHEAFGNTQTQSRQSQLERGGW
ncbi:uncharacterized protein [Manis javanica]|uniref:uncharacterized protein n=1 Tax=Manis javanica TaxID=9974 RepID=UPI003C6CC525